MAPSGIPSLLYHRISRSSSARTKSRYRDYLRRGAQSRSNFYQLPPPPFDNLTAQFSPQRQADGTPHYKRRKTIPFPTALRSLILPMPTRTARQRRWRHSPIQASCLVTSRTPGEEPPKAPSRSSGSTYYSPWGMPNPLVAAAPAVQVGGYLPYPVQPAATITLEEESTSATSGGSSTTSPLYTLI